jgi:hypothetical protein
MMQNIAEQVLQASAAERRRSAPAWLRGASMSLYFFHLVDGQDVLLDPEGTELADLAAIRKAALIAARSILSADVLEGRLPLDMHIDVQNEGGEVVHCLEFSDAVQIIPAR